MVHVHCWHHRFFVECSTYNIAQYTVQGLIFIRGQIVIYRKGEKKKFQKVLFSVHLYKHMYNTLDSIYIYITYTSIYIYTYTNIYPFYSIDFTKCSLLDMFNGGTNYTITYNLLQNILKNIGLH